MLKRNLENQIQTTLKAGKSIFLFGPRQTGKTTLLHHIASNFGKVLEYSFLDIPVRQRAEQHPDFIRREIEAERPDFVLIDEVQKIPHILDEIQLVIDTYRTPVAITGSSARKLKRKGTNLLAGRAITFHLDPLELSEKNPLLPKEPRVDDLKKILVFGDLPEIFLLHRNKKRDIAENLLRSYVETFLEEEIRAELFVRKVGLFGNFLRSAAELSGRMINLREISQDIGISHAAVSSFYSILTDCLIVEPVLPLIPKATHRRLAKSVKYLFFDIGVRNAAARIHPDSTISPEEWGGRFEQWVGLQLLRLFRSRNLPVNLHYWRDYNGLEIDWVIETGNTWIPVEVKWNSNPQEKHIRALKKFLAENPEQAPRGYLLFTGDRAQQLTDAITAIPWHSLPRILEPLSKR